MTYNQPIELMYRLGPCSISRHRFVAVSTNITNTTGVRYPTPAKNDRTRANGGGGGYAGT